MRASRTFWCRKPRAALHNASRGKFIKLLVRRAFAGERFVELSRCIKLHFNFASKLYVTHVRMWASTRQARDSLTRGFQCCITRLITESESNVYVRYSLWSLEKWTRLDEDKSGWITLSRVSPATRSIKKAFHVDDDRRKSFTSSIHPSIPLMKLMKSENTSTLFIYIGWRGWWISNFHVLLLVSKNSRLRGIDWSRVDADRAMEQSFWDCSTNFDAFRGSLMAEISLGGFPKLHKTKSSLLI